MKRKFNCLVLEDGVQSKEYIERLIKENPYLNYVATCEEEESAAEILGNGNIDILFLDIELEEGRGDTRGLKFISMVKKLKLKMPHIIITSKSNDKGLEAYELAAIDYLHKPFTQERFNEGIERILKIEPERKKLETITISTEESNGRAFSVIPVAEIMYFETDSQKRDHIKVWRLVNNTPPLISYSTRKFKMKELENIEGFMRVHHSYVVRQTYIDKVFKTEMLIQLKNNKKISIGNTYSENLKDIWE